MSSPDPRVRTKVGPRTCLIRRSRELRRAECRQDGSLGPKLDRRIKSGDDKEKASRSLIPNNDETAGQADAESGRSRWRPSLGAVLSTTLLLAVLLTAALIHFSWQTIARANLKDLVGQLNDKI